MRNGVRIGESSAESAGGVQSVDRAISVLEILARLGGAGVSEVAADIGVHKSTAFRLLSALEERGLVEQATDRGKYQLGFGILRLASAIPGRLDLVRQARPVLDELAAEFGETVNLAVVRSHYAVNVDQATTSAAVAAQNWVGQLTPLHATSSGKVLLAHLSAESRKQLLDAAGLPRYTKRTLTTRKAARRGAEDRSYRRVRDDVRGIRGRSERDRRAGTRSHRSGRRRGKRVRPGISAGRGADRQNHRRSSISRQPDQRPNGLSQIARRFVPQRPSVCRVGGGFIELAGSSSDPARWC